MGGGNKESRSSAVRINGLSPRGRGKHYLPTGGVIGIGSIPAWAGETLAQPALGSHIVVYPRVGGGNCAGPGTPLTAKGLSPRGRGKLRLTFLINAIIRSIPAWAGETCGGERRSSPEKVYPRVGGGNLRR